MNGAIPQVNVLHSTPIPFFVVGAALVTLTVRNLRKKQQELQLPKVCIIFDATNYLGTFVNIQG